MTEHVSDSYRGAAARLSVIADQLQAGSEDPPTAATVLQVFEELAAVEPDEGTRRALSDAAQHLAGTIPADPEKLRHAAVQLNHVADGYEAAQ